MATLETALAAWIGFHTNLGVDVNMLLNPPATEEQIVQVETEIGYRLPEDLRALYLIADGQWDLYDDAPPMPDENALWSPLFGYYDFLPLERALYQYQRDLDYYNQKKSFDEKYNKANPDKRSDPDLWSVREGDIVDPLGWNPGWFPFAGSDANSYFVDMTPPRGGVPGQVVLYGADEHELQVLAASVTDLMDNAAYFLDPEDAENFDYSDHDEHAGWNSVWFNMDWRYERPSRNEPENPMPPAYTAWMAEMETRKMEDVDSFRRFVMNLVSADELEHLVQWYGRNFNSMAQVELPPPEVARELAQWMEAQGESIDMTAPELSDREVAAYRQTARLKGYLHEFFLLEMSPSRVIDFAEPTRLSTQEAASLVKQYYLDSGKWTQGQKDRTESILEEFRQLPLVQERGLSMSPTDKNGLTICQPDFDKETFKSTKRCYELDISF